MREKSLAAVCLFFITTLYLADIQAQSINKKINISWNEPITFNFNENFSVEYINFKDAVYFQEFPTLPAFYEMIPVENFFSEYSVKIISQEFEELSAKENMAVPENYALTEIEYSVTSAYERRQPYALLTFIPIVKIADGKYKKLVTATIEIEGKTIKMPQQKRGYASQSVLASGEWYNFKLSETGIYKITYKDLVDMGMSVPVQSAQIAIFGNSGRMLPEANSAKRIDDLREIACQIYDGNDGTIDDGDYIIFYGESPHTTTFNSETGHFFHNTNVYSDFSTYFITKTPGIGEKKRVKTANNNNLQENLDLSEYTFFDFHEEDIYNLCESGNDWFGDRYDITLSRNYNFSTSGAPTGTGQITIRSASTTTTTSTFQVQANQSNLGNINLPAVGASSIARITSNSLPLSNLSSENLQISLTYNKPTTSSVAYLDWIEIEIPCKIALRNGQTSFRTPESVGIGNISKFNILNINTSAQVWNVTNPGEIEQFTLTAENQGASFKAKTDSLLEFIVFDGTNYKSIIPLSRVANQNLHSVQNVDLVIVSDEKFMAQATRLANFRSGNDGMTVKVVTPQQIYNEFSSGSQDPLAIRNFVKMIYDRSGKEYPKHLLLVGRPSYDYRGRVQGTEIFVPNYQYYSKSGTISEYYLYSNDDNLGLLDDEDGENAIGLYDVAVGRIPCSTVAQATTAVDKSIRYTEKRNLVGQNSAQISNFGDWRNVMAFVADDENANDFIYHADKFTQIVEKNNENINLDKIYLDAYQQVSNAGGQRYPSAVTDINNRMNRGALVYTYIGHSGKDGWAAERILEFSDINKWTNKYNMPLLISLSCTFGYYDRQVLSPTDLIYFNNNGGAAAIISATREAWSSPNNYYGDNIFSIIFDKENGNKPISVGNINRIAKNKYGGSQTNLAMFVLCGDPSMPLAIPNYNIVTDSVNHKSASEIADTARALSKVTISGHIEDLDNNEVTNFNGTIFPSVYDKKILTSSLANDPESEVFEFTMQKSLLFKGNVSVINGKFTFSFYIPKDIDYNFGNGKISYYARTDDNDAAGNFTDFIIGGIDTAGVQDDESPKIDLFLNDENFVSGGITNSNPVLIAKISDNLGINTTGNGIGHDLTAIIDNASDSKIILNDYYETEKDSFNCGTIRYNLQNIPVGDHVISVRAWDVNNNSSEQQIAFKVVSDEKLTLSHVLNYPNPFTTHTDFYFEHNQPGGIFDIKIQIFTISGKLVKTIFDNQSLEGTRSNAIPWDGTDDFGDKIAKGTYIYRISVRNQNSETAEVIEKIVIL